jgi:hypothetical protein
MLWGDVMLPHCISKYYTFFYISTDHHIMYLSAKFGPRLGLILLEAAPLPEAANSLAASTPFVSALYIYLKINN